MQGIAEKPPRDTAGANLLESHSAEPGAKRTPSASQTIYQKQEKHEKNTSYQKKTEKPEKSNGKKCHIYTSITVPLFVASGEHDTLTFQHYTT